MTSIVAERYARAIYQLTAMEADGQKQLRVARAFVSLLAKRQLLSKLDIITDAFERYAREEDDRRRLRLIAARSLGDETKRFIESHDPRLREASLTVDQGIIGGLVVGDGSIIMDASIKRQCQELQSRLIQ